MIADAARRAAFTIVNAVPDASRSVCADDGRRWVSATGIGPSDEGTPFHPTRAGRAHLAHLVADAARPQLRG